MLRILKFAGRFVRSALVYMARITVSGLVALRLLESSRKAGEREPTERPGGGAGRFQWKRRLRTVGGFLTVAAIGGFLLAASGIMPIKASSGHWAITEWFLSFSMSRSVATHSIGIKALPADTLDSRMLVLKGAGHYETGCAPCHGSPAFRQPRVPQAMTPTPPYLPPKISEWNSKELFYIVKHGVKFTGMPAWPTQKRDDEVWAMVAFLRVLPGLEAAEYRQLTRITENIGGVVDLGGELDERQAVAQLARESCARCHGLSGRGGGAGAFPRLAGQHPTYLYNTLQAYAEEERHSGIMEPLAAALRPEQMRALAQYYGDTVTPSLLGISDTTAPNGAAQDTLGAGVMELEGSAEMGRGGMELGEVATEGVESAADIVIQRGAAIAHDGVPGEGIPSCADCHGPVQHSINPAYPLLSGQFAEYLSLQLRLFKEERRGGTEYLRLMHPTAHRLTEEQIRAVSAYYESLATIDAVANTPAQ